MTLLLSWTEILQPKVLFVGAAAVVVLGILVLLFLRNATAKATLGAFLLLALLAVAVLSPYVVGDPRAQREAHTDLERTISVRTSALEVLRRDLLEVIRFRTQDLIARELDVTPVTRLNLRAGPSTDEAVLGLLEPNQKLVFSGREADLRGDWILVTAGGQTGWVNRRYLITWFVLSGNSAPTEISARPLFTMSATELRARPSYEAVTLTSLPPDTKVAPQSRNGLWWQVRHQLDVGWVRTEDLRFADSPETKSLYALRAWQAWGFVFPESTTRGRILGLLLGLGLSVLLELVLGPAAGAISATRVGILLVYFLAKLWILASPTIHEFFIAGYLAAVLCVALHWLSSKLVELVRS